MNGIWEMLKSQGRHISFHTPGHKRPGPDITELSYSDNLSSPTGVLKRAEEDVARLLGADRSFLLTDGSTCGVFSMLYALSLKGVKKIALPRFSHPSVFHACEVIGISPVLIEQRIEYGIPRQPSAEEWERALSQADGAIATSPDYYGFAAPLSKIKASCLRAGKPLAVDGAHGGHLRFLELHAGRYADLWVDGVHKSLPALTQGAVVSAKGEWCEPLGRAVLCFRTTSPSYPILASVEYAVKFPRNEKIESAAIRLRKELGGIENDDWTKLLLPFGAACKNAAATLEKRGIYPEFQDGNYLLFYLSPCTKERELKILRREVMRLPRGEVPLGAPCGKIPMYQEES